MIFSDIQSQYCRHVEKDWEVLSTKSHGIYVEVGTYHGASACAAATSTKIVHTIDIFDWKPKIWELIPEFRDKIHYYKMTSVDFSDKYKHNLIIDTLFIDGSHEYDSVKKDCEALIPMVRPGGTIFFHDHNPNNPVTGVFSAVNEFLLTFPNIQLSKEPGTSNLLQVTKL